ncbi:DUF262 domain-containing HNH endonuclease family protein [Spiroplasma endosymbiont of Cantharis rufa]|uniref:DUF262 domain-containing protein n=1 Tax=Spiroplasma endosymbiont of Cantharis rufa TaxID=3066279 RepID=UPI0030D3D715
MEARLLSIHNFFDNSSSQFYIPVFQREYVWNTTNINQLLTDLESVLEQKHESHFFGNVIYKTYNKDNFTLKQLIDGQQRVTTFFLILNSIKNYLLNNDSNNEYIERITDLFLENRFIPDKYKLKLKPEIDNTDVYEKISKNELKELENNSKKYNKNNLFNNYKIIEKTILKWFNWFGIEKIFNLFSKIKIVQIIIEEKDNVDPHRIFESINSTGVDLSNFDLIRNYILMKYNDDEQEKMFRDLWKPLEIRISSINKKTIDKIIRILIQFLKKDYVSEKEIYHNFKEIFVDTNEKEIIKKLNYALDLYEYFYHKDNDKIEKVNYDTFVNLQPNKNELYATIFMILLDKYKSKQIDEIIYNESIKILSEYILRRKVADLDTSPITRFFNETLIKKIRNESTNLAKILKEELFSNVNDTQMYAPSNSEIKNRLENINFYDLAICKIFLWYLENWNNPIHLRFNSLTIEHIAPKSFSKGNWIENLEVENEVEYQNKINLLGNLTILPDKANKILANDSWEIKQTKLAEFKHIKLNEDLLSINKFDIYYLLNRQKKLVDHFFNIFL